MSEVASAAPDTATPAEAPAETTNEAPHANVTTPKSSTAKAKASTPTPDAPQADDSFEITVNGKKKTLTREQAIRTLQKQEAAEERFSAAAELTRKNQALLEALKNPEHREKVLEHLLGDEFDTVAESRLARKAQNAMLSPEERQQRDMAEKLARYEAQERTRAEAQKRSQAEALQAQHIGHYEQGLSALADKVGLPSTPESLSMLAQFSLEMLEYEEAGIQLTPEQIEAEFRERVEGTSRERDQKIARGLTGEKLLGYLGENTVKAVIDAVTSKYNATNPYQTPITSPAAPESKASRKMYSEAEYLAEMKRL